MLLAALLCAGTSSAYGVEIKTDDDINNPSNKTIRLQITGRFESGDGLKIRAFIAKLPSNLSIVAQFDSGGGIDPEAMSIGRFFHQLGIVTEVPAKARCVSPCPLAFFGGRSAKGGSGQIKHSSASFGFTPYSANSPEKDYTVKDLDAAVASEQQSILNIMDYLIEVNADLDMLRRNYEESSGARYMSDEDLLSLGVSIYDDKSSRLIEAKALQERAQR